LRRITPCGPLQASLLGSFESAHKESSTRAIHVVVLEQTNIAITNCFTEILVEFAAKEAAAERLMEVELRATRELQEKAACDAGYLAWPAY
jgi:hypothetical protein